MYDSPDYQIVGSTSYYEVQDGQKFKFQAVLENGNRFTDVLVVSTKNDELVISASFEKEESREEVAKALAAEKVAAIATEQQTVSQDNSVRLADGRYGGYGDAIGTYRCLDPSLLRRGSCRRVYRFHFRNSL